MSDPKTASDQGRQESLDVAEEARETEWHHPSFAGGLFVGDLRPELIFPFPEQPADDRKKGEEFAAEVERFLLDHLDPEELDVTGDMPQEVIDGLVELGAFSMKIPEEHGGKGFTQSNYNRVVSRVASYCSSTAVWLSAHQSIGVPNPLKMFGTDEQKERYFPRLANGELSAFALTEPGVGSDPAKMETHAEPSDDGEAWILNGEKLWCTNGPIADILVVMASTPVEIDGKVKKRHTAFIVEKTMPGITVEHRCDFVGLKGIQNGVLRFEDVRVPKENVLWGVGKGLKLALITLNSGRLTLPACCSAVARLCLSISRRWASEREQWGAPIGKHEAVAHKLAFMASHAFAMDAITEFATSMVDQGGKDVRIEAAMAKLFCSTTLWRIADETLQIRGGRGYETSRSLRARGEAPFPVERIVRDARINTIVEGTTEIMHLFLAREALDPHLRRAGDLFLKKLSLGQKAKIVLDCALFYPVWMVKQYLPFGGPKTPDDLPAELRGHFSFVKATSRKLARRTFLKMVRHGPALERKEAMLDRVVDIGVDLTVMAAACARAAAMAKANPGDRSPIELASLFCDAARRRIDAAFRGMSSNDDAAANRVARGVLEERYAWMERGFVEPDAFEAKLAERKRGSTAPPQEQPV
ncbi:MAG: acyl-CoA dehydrogenase family protein [Planctomycetota bacterium JB042]